MSIVIRPSKALPKVFIYRDPIDFRKAHRGLAAIVELELGHNLFDGYLYAFTNRQRNKIKCLFSAIAPALPYLLHPCSRGSAMGLCSITRAYPRKNSSGQRERMS